MKTIQRPDYGADAPGVMKELCLGGLGFLAAGFLVLNYGSGLWRLILGGSLTLAGTVLFLLFCSMVAYAKIGKFRVRDFMLGRVVWRGDERVLDIGTGRGLLLIGAAKHLTTGGEAVGIDIWRSEDLTGNVPEAPLRNARLEGVEQRVRVRDGDARKLDFPDSSVDVVLSLFCIHNIDSPQEQAQACREIERVLKPGGKALVGEYLPTHNYAKIFTDSGLKVIGSRPYFGVALSLTWIVEAVKDEAAVP